MLKVLISFLPVVFAFFMSSPAEASCYDWCAEKGMSFAVCHGYCGRGDGCFPACRKAGFQFHECRTHCRSGGFVFSAERDTDSQIAFSSENSEVMSSSGGRCYIKSSCQGPSVERHMKWHCPRIGYRYWKAHGSSSCERI